MWIIKGARVKEANALNNFVEGIHIFVEGICSDFNTSILCILFTRIKYFWLNFWLKGLEMFTYSERVIQYL